MNFLYDVKENFKREATSFHKMDDKTMFYAGLIILFNIVYLVAHSRHMFQGLEFISNRGLNIIVFTLVSLAFLYVLRHHLYKTVSFTPKKLGKSVIYANIIFMASYFLYGSYNYIMHFFSTKMSGDVQHIRQMAKIDWETYGTLVLRYVVSLLNEELLIIAVFLIILSLFKTNKVKYTLFAMFASLFFFAFLHMVSWNPQTIPAVMVSKMPACLMFICLKDIKPLYLAHLFNNSWVALVTVGGMTGAIKNEVAMVFLLPCILYAIYCIICHNMYPRSQEE